MTMPPRFATDPAVVASEAAVVAAAWSGPDAPESWRLVAAQLEALRDDPELREIAAGAPPDRLPALLFTAAAAFLVLTLEPQPLRAWFPRLGVGQAPLQNTFFAEYRAFCLDHRTQLRELMSEHRYQMSEVARCAGLVLGLDPALGDGREIAFVDVGTGAGLALHFDRYAYRFTGPGTAVGATGAGTGAAVTIETAMRGTAVPPIPARLPRVVERIGIDVEPLDVGDEGVRAWLTACIPQTIEAVTRFDRAARLVVADPPTMIRADACAALADVLAEIPPQRFVCVQDSFVSVFFGEDERRRFRALIDDAGHGRDLDWISIDPLVPLGATATDTVVGRRAPEALVERNHSDGVFGVINRVSYRDGDRSESLLGIAHPGAAWHEWLGEWGPGRP